MHCDAISRDNVWISAANKPRGPLQGKYWCMVVPGSDARRTLRSEIQEVASWPKLLANMPAEPREHPPSLDRGRWIVQHQVQRHCPTPTQALAVGRPQKSQEMVHIVCNMMDRLMEEARHRDIGLCTIRERGLSGRLNNCVNFT